MIRLRVILLFVPALGFLTGCAGNNSATAEKNVDSQGDTVSSVPWNKPESWETTGQLGSMGGPGH